MDPTGQIPSPSPPPPASPPVTKPTPPPHPVLSTGTISSTHIKWVSELRVARGQWSSEVQGPWVPAENDYFEFTYELFHDGLLKGIEVGLPVRYFMSELLGCTVQRIDNKLVEDKRFRDLQCPRIPQRELSSVEHRGLSAKLVRLEMAFLAREQGPLHNGVRFNAQGDTSRFLRPELRQTTVPQSAPSSFPKPALEPLRTAAPSTLATVSHPLPTSMIQAASNAARNASVEYRHAAANPAAPATGLRPPPTTTARGAYGGAQPPVPAPPRSTVPSSQNVFTVPTAGMLNRQPVRAAQPLSVAVGAPPAEGIHHAAQRSDTGRPPHQANGRATGEANGMVAHPRSVGIPTISAVTASTGQSARPESNGSHQVGPGLASPKPTEAPAAASPTQSPKPTTSFVDSKGRRHPYLPGSGLKRNHERLHAAATAPPPPPGGMVAPSPRRTAKASPEAVGLEGRVLGRRLLGVAMPGGADEEPPMQRRRTSSSSRSDAPPYATSTGRAHRDLWDGSMPESPEDAAAMEYLKWELHGKFMAFPGEHYHNLLASLASEIYHNRYPVEHGVDILHGVMRDAGPEALQKCAVTLKRMNVPTRMML